MDAGKANCLINDEFVRTERLSDTSGNLRHFQHPVQMEKKKSPDEKVVMSSEFEKENWGRDWMDPWEV